MKSMLNVKTDATLKKQAQQVARDLGLPLGTIINRYLKELVAERSVVFTDHPVPNAKTRRIIEAALADIKAGKNLSPVFTNAEDAIKWLKR